MIKYFHELTREEAGEILAGKTFAWIAENYPQPEWCNDSEATEVLIGCWRLTCTSSIKDRSSCEGCGYLRPEQPAQNEDSERS